MSTVPRDDIKELRGDIKEVREQATKTAVNVASLQSTMDATLKQSDTIVMLLQGNGQRGLVKNVSEVKVRVGQCEEELKSRKLNNQHNRRATIGYAVGIVLVILAAVLPVFFHFLSH